MQSKNIVLGLFLLSSVLIYAQNARDMDRILSEKELSYTQAVQFILPAAGITTKTASEKGLLPTDAEAEKKISTGDLSLLLMKSFELKGGIMYSFFPNPRYAYRELRYRRCIPDSSDPIAKVTGEQFLHILGRVLSYTGEDL
ncbi:hypothetical protein [Treponema primitia]|uniref:hypothetical protein n=1 Tax=Treponema primitia TaxID=88058 RepID=UPI0002555695|nr:hypothetical protein [Treponema primitia]